MQTKAHTQFLWRIEQNFLRFVEAQGFDVLALKLIERQNHFFGRVVGVDDTKAMEKIILTFGFHVLLILEIIGLKP